MKRVLQEEKKIKFLSKNLITKEKKDLKFKIKYKMGKRGREKTVFVWKGI